MGAGGRKVAGARMLEISIRIRVRAVRMGILSMECEFFLYLNSSLFYQLFNLVLRLMFSVFMGQNFDFARLERVIFSHVNFSLIIFGF